MSGAEEEWVKAAMTNDTMVVELLVRLQASAPPPPLEWSVRQRRSRSVSLGSIQKKQSQRASPTTPLSWSGGGDEGSSRPAGPVPSSADRSKVNSDRERTASKRTKKKKTLAELRDEESILVKERRLLKRQLAALGMSLGKLRATNESLKRMKIEVHPKKPISDQPHHTAAHNAIRSRPSGLDGCGESKALFDAKFALPDLNMPLEEDSCLDVVCGAN